MRSTAPDARRGLYDPAYEHDACGVGFVADVTGAAGTRALAGALRALDNLTHREAERRVLDEGLPLYAPSFSARTVVYKGLLAGGDLATFYPDLADPRYETAVALFHQRYSTNTM